MWKEIGVMMVAGAVMSLIAYLSGADAEVLLWILAMLFVTVAIRVICALTTNKPNGSAINSLSVSEDLGYEIDLLVQQIENSAKDMLGHVHKELSQMRSLVSDAIEVLQNSFNDLNKESKQQNRMVQEVLEKLQAAQSSKSRIDELLDGRVSELSESNKRMDKSITDAVRSLQFEDIVRQLTVSSEKHLNYLERVLGTVDEGIRSLNSQHINVPEYIVGLHELKSQIDQLEAECKAEADRSVSQKTMQKGEIELF
jgi:methyl-accepting chemotaxis protein